MSISPKRYIMYMAFKGIKAPVQMLTVKRILQVTEYGEMRKIPIGTMNVSFVSCVS